MIKPLGALLTDAVDMGRHGQQVAYLFPIRFTFTVEGEQVRNLLSMTPHVYRISKEGAQRLNQTQRLTDTASAVLNIYAPV